MKESNKRMNKAFSKRNLKGSTKEDLTYLISSILTPISAIYGLYYGLKFDHYLNIEKLSLIESILKSF